MTAISWVNAWLLIGILWCSFAFTAEVEELQPLDFGIFAVPSNLNESTIAMPFNGAIPTATGSIVFVEIGHRGEYRLTEFPPSTPLYLDWPTEVWLRPGGIGPAERFRITDFTNPEVNTDPSGSATMVAGATLRTSATNTLYFDTVYTGTLPITVQYWSLEVGAVIAFQENVTITAAVRTAVDLAEVESLDFGLMAAVADSDPGEHATLTVAPDGKVTMTQAGSALIGSLGGAHPGLIAVSGAAPLVFMTIDVTQPDTVYLTHDAGGGESARFIVEDFQTIPSGIGRTTSEGQFDIQVGATLKTEITAKPYRNGTYSGRYQLTVTY